MNCLIVGPGRKIAPNTGSDLITWTYQPYELVNSLTRSDVQNFKISVIDINQEVISEFDKRPTLIEATDDFMEHDSYYYEHGGEFQQARTYYKNFMTNFATFESAHRKVISLPDELSSRILATKMDLVNASLPKKKYDLVICTVLLSHYSDFAVLANLNSNSKFPVEKMINKLEGAVKKGGFMIDSGEVSSNDGWKDIYHARLAYAVHNEYIELRKKL